MINKKWDIVLKDEMKKPYFSIKIFLMPLDTQIMMK